MASRSTPAREILASTIPRLDRRMKQETSPTSSTRLPRELELPILYRDEHLVVVDKPAGLLVHRSPIDRHETRFALQLVRDQLGQRVYPVHRLDKPTSGALALALSPESARVLSTAFANDAVHKRYVALVRGWPEASGTIDRPLAAV